MSDLNKTIRTRFAPSPTGFVHVGSLRTALFAFLFARHSGGVNVLRVEDTDQNRFVEGSLENMITVMKNLGVEFDEGPLLINYKIEQRGDFGPYIQSERTTLYQEHAKKLIESGKAYYCFCTVERLDELRKEQTALKKPPMYDRFCKKLSKEEIDDNLASGKTYVVRQAIPETGTTVIEDLVYGKISYENSVLDDHVLLKSDGYPTYHLAVVVDDHLMEITHVVRGEDWLPSTPKHYLLYQDFGWEAPAFAHLPLIVNPDKTKLSKRQGDVSVESFLQRGYLPEALINFMAFLGWNPKTEQEIFSMEELIAQFDLSKVNKSGAVFDYVKLDWMNSHYIRAKSNSELLELLKPYLLDYDLAQLNQDYLNAVVEIEKDRLKTLAQISDHAGFYFGEPEYNLEILVWKKADKDDAKQKLKAVKNFLAALTEADFAKDKIEEKLKTWITEQGFQTGNVLWPLRTSLTGLEKSPSPFEMLSCLYLKDGLVTINKRLDKAISTL